MCVVVLCCIVSVCVCVCFGGSERVSVLVQVGVLLSVCNILRETLRVCCCTVLCLFVCFICVSVCVCVCMSSMRKDILCERAALRELLYFCVCALMREILCVSVCVCV